MNDVSDIAMRTEEVVLAVKLRWSSIRGRRLWRRRSLPTGVLDAWDHTMARAMSNMPREDVRLQRRARVPGEGIGHNANSNRGLRHRREEDARGFQARSYPRMFAVLSGFQ